VSGHRGQIRVKEGKRSERTMEEDDVERRRGQNGGKEAEQRAAGRGWLAG
jgi:hypothetical protein